MTETNPVIIRAVKNLCRQEQEDWWAAILADRLASTVLFSLHEDQKAFQYWAELAARPGYDVNVVYGPAGEKLAFFWTSGLEGLGAFFHFGFLEAGLARRMEIGRYVLNLMWSCGYKCLASITPAERLHVIAYGQALGGRVMGLWPGVCYLAAQEKYVDGILIQFKPREGD
jgi:hypothetical protein